MVYNICLKIKICPERKSRHLSYSRGANLVAKISLKIKAAKDESGFPDIGRIMLQFYVYPELWVVEKIHAYLG